jgi:hypothetical protein
MAMKLAKLIVLLGGILGVLAFFLPMASFEHHGKHASVSAFQLFTGVSDLEDRVDGTKAVEGMTPEQLGKAKQDVYETLSEIKGIVLACFLPGALLALIGLIGVARGKFGRLAGIVSILLGAVALLVFAGLNTGAEASAGEAARGPALFLLLGTGALGCVGGMLALVSPERGPPAG